MNHVSVSPTDGNGPTQGQRKTLTRVGIEPIVKHGFVKRGFVKGGLSFFVKMIALLDCLFVYFCLSLFNLNSFTLFSCYVTASHSKNFSKRLFDVE